MEADDFVTLMLLACVALFLWLWWAVEGENLLYAAAVKVTSFRKDKRYLSRIERKLYNGDAMSEDELHYAGEHSADLTCRELASKRLTEFATSCDVIRI